MKLGILEAGKMAGRLEGVHGDFPFLFRRWLTPHLRDVAFTTYSVVENEWPNGPDACDGWLITGSRFGVYDDEPFIEPLKQFIREAAAAGKPQVGICFGHQIIAEAMGGRVEKSDKGWGVGIHTYRVALEDGSVDWPMLVSHQDQVLDPPPGARVIGGNDFCPNGVIAYDAPILTAQFHPEITPGLSADIIRLRTGVSFDETVAQQGLASLTTPPAEDAAGRWMGGWLLDRMG